MDWSSNFTKKYIFALLLIALLATLGFINLNYLTNLQSNDSKTINLSGKQRMFSQVIYNSVISFDIKKLKHTIKRMEESHNYLISLEMTHKIKEIYFGKSIQLDKKVKEYLANSKKIKDNIKDTNRIYIIKHSRNLLEEFDRVTLLYQLESEEKIKQVKYFEMLIYIITLAALILIALFIFKPANKKFELRAKEITDEKDYSNIVIESNTNAIISVGKDLKVRTFNKAAQRIFGYSKEEMIGKDSLLKIVPSMYHTAHKIGVSNHFKTGVFKHNGATLELEAKRKNGEIFPIKISFGENEHDETNERLVIANIQDITVEKQKEKLLITNEKIYKDLFELNKLIILLVNPINGNIVNVNKSAIDFYRYEKTKFLTLNISDINILPFEEIQKAMNLVIENKENSFNFTHKLSNSEERHVKVHSTPTIYNDETVLYVTVTDITEEFEAKNKLVALEEEFKNFFEFSNVGLAVIDTKGNILRINQKLVDIFGYSSQNEFLGKSWESFVPEEHTDNELILLNEFKNNKIDTYKDEKIFIKKDKSNFDIFVTMNSFKVEGDTQYILASIVDISKMKKKDTLLFQQSKMASMGEMIDNIAHQWRQPLSVISTAVTGIKFKIELEDTIDEKDLIRFTDHVSNSVTHLSQTIDDFRNFFKQNKTKKEFKLSDTIEKVFNLLISQFKTANINIVKNIEDITIYGFENELIQVIINIVNNARDELIKKDSKERFIIIHAIKNNENIEITIKDNAGGIPEDIIDRIFDSHFTTKEDSQGTGIGLYMSKMIVEEQMKGSIEVSNSQFTFEDKVFNGALFKIVFK